MTIRDETTVTHASDIAWVGSPERVVILRLSSLAAEPLTLTGSAAVIWQAVSSRRSIRDVVSEMGEVYGLPDEEIRESVVAFVSECLAQRVMVDVGS